MKTLVKEILITLILMMIVSFGYSQKGVEDGSRFGHGEDSVRCIKNYSMFREYVKQKNYDLAIEPWKIVYTECPKSTKYIYIDGIKMIERDIQKAEGEEKAALVDSMMNIYKKRIQYYGQKGFVLGNMGIDYIKYAENTTENMQKAYEWLKESISLEKHKSGAAELLTFMQTSNALFQANSIEGGIVVEDYGVISEIADHIIKNQIKGWENVEKAKAAIDQVFETSGAASCEDLVPFYATKFSETPEDLEFLKKSTDLLRSTKCTDSDLFFKMLDKLNSLEPAANPAYELAKLANQSEKLEASVNYYLQAIELQEDATQKAKYYLELGDVTRRIGDYPKARSYALKSAELDPNSGYPYLLIGNIYAASSKSCSEDEFYQKTVYWVAVDKFMKAKAIDPALTDDANKFIEAYKPHFPDNETIFFYNLKVGDIYTVECWINEKTTVRAR